MCEDQDRQSIHFNRCLREVDFKEGDLVLLNKEVHQPKSGTKFHNLWFGPFRNHQEIVIRNLQFRSQSKPSSKT